MKDRHLKALAMLMPLPTTLQVPRPRPQSIFEGGPYVSGGTPAQPPIPQQYSQYPQGGGAVAQRHEHAQADSPLLSSSAPYAPNQVRSLFSQTKVLCPSLLALHHHYLFPRP